MNTLKDMAVLNIIQTDGKCAPEANRDAMELFQLLNFEQIENIIGRSFLAGGGPCWVDLKMLKYFLHFWVGLNTN